MTVYRSSTATSVPYHELRRFSGLVRKYAPGAHPDGIVGPVSFITGERRGAQIDVKVLIDVEATEGFESEVSDAAEEAVTHALHTVGALPREYGVTVEIVI
jgi:hypothetical protein